MQQEQKPPGVFEQYRSFLGWALYFAQVLALSVEVLLRRQFGARYFGAQAAMVLPVILVFTLVFEGEDVTPLWLYLGLYIVLLAKRRAEIMRRVRRGDEVHSYYSGQPDVLRWPVFRWANERLAKSTIEPLMILGYGILLMPLSEPLGTYLVLAAIGLFTSVRMAFYYERVRLMEMQDAYLEQRHMADLFRRGNRR